MDSKPVLDRNQFCSLCSLVCSRDQYELKSGGSKVLPTPCDLRNLWLERRDQNAEKNTLVDMASCLNRLEQSLSAPGRTLLWVTGADVQSMRALVRLANHYHATLHVGSSTGREILKRVALVEGWNGASLADVANAADIVITFGDELLANAPLLPERFLRSDGSERRLRWFHVGMGNPVGESQNVVPDQIIPWPRTEWLDRLIGLNQDLRQSIDQGTGLACELQQASNVSLIIDSDQWASELDELVLLQLSVMVEHLNKAARCTIVSLEQIVGRLTAEETLRWLTGFSPSTACVNGQYKSVNLCGMTLDQFRSSYDQIILIRTLPTVVPFPSMEPDLVVAPELMGIESDLFADRWLPISAVGLDIAGHVFRGDGGTQVLLERIESETSDRFERGSSERESTNQLASLVQVVDRLLTYGQQRSREDLTLASETRRSATGKVSHGN